MYIRNHPLLDKAIARRYMDTRTEQKRVKDRRIHWQFEEFIRRRAVRGLSAAQIQRELSAKLQGTGRKPPDGRTIRDIVKEHAVEDRSGPWQLGDSASDADATAVLAAMAVVYRDGYNARITRAEADWIARIAPHADYWWEEDGKRGLEPQSLWILARQYLACEANQRSTLPIELLLAFKPWREDSWRRKKYQETLDRLGLKPLTYLWLLPEDSAEGDSDE
jgi:hypothetical protein